MTEKSKTNLVGDNHNFRYSAETTNFGKLPPYIQMGEAAGVAVNNSDLVYVYNRGEYPVIVFDTQGDFKTAWGRGTSVNPHGISIGPDNEVYCVDAGDHTLKKFDSNGSLLLTIGTPGKSSGRMSGLPFCHPTHAAISPTTGEIFVSDGYSNAAVHKFDPNGKHILSWGRSGTDPGEFNTVHNIAIDDDWVYIADRENHRIQVFDSDGKYETQWGNLAMASCIYIQKNPEQFFYVGEFFAGIRENPGGLGNWTGERLGPRISVLDNTGNIVARIGNKPIGLSAGEFVAPHGISLDSKDNIYLGEVSWSAYGNNFNPPKKVRTIQKLTKL